jgi:hypothetical protein
LRGKDKTAPTHSVQRPDIGIFPGIGHVSAKGDEKRGSSEESEDQKETTELMALGHVQSVFSKVIYAKSGPKSNPRWIVWAESFLESSFFALLPGNFLPLKEKF